MAEIINIKQAKSIKRSKENVDKLIQLDEEMADQVALMLVKHLASTTTAEEIDARRLIFILDEVVNQVNTKYT